MPEEMRKILDGLKNALGPDWAEKLAEEMTADERQHLDEALNPNKPNKQPPAPSNG